jgi:hypothetical protein
MAYDSTSLENYIEVSQRIADFRETYPHGSLQPADLAMPYHVVRVPAAWCQQCIGRRVVKDGREQGGDKKWRDKWADCPRCAGTGVRREDEPAEDCFIVYAAAAYRTPDDPRPGIGIAWEPFPGRTPYTAASELMNAETSAWGRAIIAVGASDSKPGIASRDEVRTRRAEREDGLPQNRDGSLSRSQTTDAEKEAAGVMTSAQHAEHTALQPKAAETRGRSQRSSATPDDDPFYDASGPPLPGQPAKGGKPSLAKMFSRYAQLGVTDDIAMRLDLCDILGRPVESRSSLTAAEVAKVNAVLLDRLAEGGVPAR